MINERKVGVDGVAEIRTENLRTLHSSALEPLKPRG
jgi:hypothetical protein